MTPLNNSSEVKVPRDCYELLAEPRRPLVDGARLQETFVRLCAPLHPDHLTAPSEAMQKEATDQFSDLNAAYSCLKDTRLRLKHLLELETGSAPTGLENVSHSATELYFSAGQACRQADEVLSQMAKAKSPLLRAQYCERMIESMENLRGIQAQLGAKHRDLENALKSLNPFWESAPPPGSDGRIGSLPLPQLEQLYREFCYEMRWTEQVRQRLLELAL